jgi:uroporphyrinogen-III synthase
VGAPLEGRRIVITRPTTGRLGERLVADGAQVDHVPLISIGPPADGGAALRAALAELDRFDWLVVTSGNGAAEVGDAAAGHRAVHLAAVGPATAAVLEARAGRPVDLVPQQPDADGLLAAFPPAPTRVLLAQADLAGDRLAAGLRAAGHDVVAVEAYRTMLVPPGDDELRLLAGADAVVLASGSAADSWSRALAGEPSTVPAAVVAIGRRTAAAAVRLGFRIAAVASSPDDDGILAAVRRAVAVR